MNTLERIEDRLLDLEFKDLKQRVNASRPVARPAVSSKSKPAAKRQTVSDSWLAATKAPPRHPRSVFVHADGRVENLDYNRRSAWSSEAKEAAALCEKADQMRRCSNGYLVSTPCQEPVRLRE